MDKMVITFTDSGEVQHTLRDSKFNTSFLGNRKVKRMSEIVHVEATQRFIIRLIHKELIKYYGTTHVLKQEARYSSQIAEFDTYEDAVAEEIRFVDDLRVKGVKISS